MKHLKYGNMIMNMDQESEFKVGDWFIKNVNKTRWKIFLITSNPYGSVYWLINSDGVLDRATGLELEVYFTKIKLLSIPEYFSQLK